MSYILDALKKSEQEREQKQAQDRESINHHATIVEAENVLGAGSQAQAQKPTNEAVNTVSNQSRYQEKLNFLSFLSGSQFIKVVYLLLILLAVVVLIKTFTYKNENTFKSIKIDQTSQLATEFNNFTSAENLTSSSVENSSSVEDSSSVETHTAITKKIEPQKVATAVVGESSGNTQLSVADSSSADFTKGRSIAIEEAAEEVVSDLPVMNISSHIFSTQADRRSIVVNGQRLVEGSYVASGVKVAEITHQGMIIQVKGRLLVVSRSRGWK